MIEEAIYNTLKNDADLATLTNGRIYPVFVPDGVELDNTIMFIEIDKTNSLPNVVSSEFQISCFADTIKKARTLADHVERLFNTQENTILGGELPITMCRVTGRNLLYDGETGIYHFAVDVFIKY